mmetsp:Transcript_20610/g.26246  ORF Transcript_20610/g.26246 Transcript_20610/m.26246 type:complete len:86 (+) Transcript_20610:232-489(+)
MPNHHTAGLGYTICTAAYHWMITLSLIAIISIPSDEAFIITSRQSPSQRIHRTQSHSPSSVVHCHFPSPPRNIFLYIERKIVSML